MSTTQTTIVTCSADQVTTNDLLIGHGPVTHVQQTGGVVDITYMTPGTGSGLGTMSCRADTKVKVRR